MTRTPWRLAVCILAACQSADGPAAPSSDPTTPSPLVTHFRDRVFFTNDLVVENTCTGEDILLHLDQMFVIHEVDQVGKAFHGHLTFMDRGTVGVGLTSGATYRQTGAEKENILLRTDAHVVNSLVFGLNLIGQGPVPNARLHETVQVTITPAGVVTVAFDKIRDTCQGG